MLIVQKSVFIKIASKQYIGKWYHQWRETCVFCNYRYLGVIFLCSKNCSSVEITSIMNVLFNKKIREELADLCELPAIFSNVVVFKRRTYYFIVVNICESIVFGGWWCWVCLNHDWQKFKSHFIPSFLALLVRRFA